MSSMKIAYFDCFAGISGDMLLGALVDAGLDPGLLQEEIGKLDLPHLSTNFNPVSRHDIAAIQAKVCFGSGPVAPGREHHLDLNPEPHGHNRLGHILSVIRSSRLDEDVKATSIRIFERLAQAEAQVHGVSVDEVHLHEVGSHDAIVDIVGTVAALRLLAIDEVYASTLRMGTGFVQCAHGSYPIPAPGVLALCQDIPCEQTQIRAELVTPTGAAIITTIARAFGSPPAFVQESVGYGAGSRDLDEIPNLLRVRIGSTPQALSQDRAVLFEANIDDMNPEIYGYLFDLLFERGARDVYITPVQMKKGRPGNLLSILADESLLDVMVGTVLAETTTMGVRFHFVERRKLERSVTSVATPYGPVSVKVCSLDGIRRLAPEYEDCARLARRHEVPIQAVYAAARSAIPEE